MSASSTLHWAKRFLSRSHGSRHFAALPVRSEVVGKTMAMFSHMACSLLLVSQALVQRRTFYCFVAKLLA